MTWIRTISPEESEGELRSLFKAIASARGGVADVHHAQSLNPRALAAHLALYRAVVFQPSSLSRRDRERIAVVVSRENGCRYCVAHHAAALRDLGDDEAVIAALSEGLSPAGLPPGELALLEWARRGCAAPAQCANSDVASLREHGHDDRAILDAALTVAYFSFVNRIVLMLGVELEPDYGRTCREPTAST